MTDETERVLTNEELRELDITPELAEQALEQTRERAQYILEMRHKIEVRAATLLRVFMSLALAIVGFGFGLERLAGGAEVAIANYVLGAAPLFLASACVVAAIWDRPYPTMGGPGYWWVREGAIDGDESFVAFFNACLAASYERANDCGFRSNETGILCIRVGLAISLLTPVCLLVAF